jgi:hypothetical protein
MTGGVLRTARGCWLAAGVFRLSCAHAGKIQ